MTVNILETTVNSVHHRRIMYKRNLSQTQLLQQKDRRNEKRRVKLYTSAIHLSPPGADLGILVGGVDSICNTYNLSATPFLQISLSAGQSWGGVKPLNPFWIRLWPPLSVEVLRVSDPNVDVLQEQPEVSAVWHINLKDHLSFSLLFPFFLFNFNWSLTVKR